MLLETAEGTEQLGRALARAVRPGDVVALFGELGAGKTTLTRGILRGLGFEGDVGSPTFPIVQAYEPPDTALPLWHVDLYRIDDPAELEELALDDVLDGGALVIEWPERLGTRLWPQALRLHLSAAPSGARVLTVKVPPAWEARWPLP